MQLCCSKVQFGFRTDGYSLTFTHSSFWIPSKLNAKLLQTMTERPHHCIRISVLVYCFIILLYCYGRWKIKNSTQSKTIIIADCQGINWRRCCCIFAFTNPPSIAAEVQFFLLLFLLCFYLKSHFRFERKYLYSKKVNRTRRNSFLDFRHKQFLTWKRIC